MRLRSIVSVVLLALTFATAGCETVPYTGRSQLSLTSEQQEMQLGAEAFTEVLGKEKLSAHRPYVEMLNRVGARISAVAEKPGYGWEFKVVASATENAFCLPGGKVVVYTGIMKLMANEGELASVVAHEVAHALARHGGERMSHGMLQQLGAILVQSSTSEMTPEERDKWMAAYGGITNVGFMLPYSRSHETEADYIGLMLMAKAGYDPNAALDFWSKFGKDGDAVGEFLSTHPSGPTRIADIKKALPEAAELYRQAPTKYGLGEKIDYVGDK